MVQRGPQPKSKNPHPLATIMSPSSPWEATAHAGSPSHPTQVRRCRWPGSEEQGKAQPPTASSLAHKHTVIPSSER